MTQEKFWQHKKTKKLFRVMPWWETVPSSDVIGDKELPIPEIGTPWKFGMLVQIGYLLENDHGVWFGFNSKVRESFQEITKRQFYLRSRKKRGKKKR